MRQRNRRCFFDFYLVDKERLGFVIADVSGKEIPAAIFMAVSRTPLKSYGSKGLSPADCLAHVKTCSLPEKYCFYFVTIFMVVNTATGEIEMLTAGTIPVHNS